MVDIGVKSFSGTIEAFMVAMNKRIDNWIPS